MQQEFFYVNQVMRAFASGAILPLSLFPEFLQNILGKLPYIWMYNFPINTMLGKVSAEQFETGIITQAIWILIFTIIATVLWQFGLKRYDAPEQSGQGEA